MKTVKVILFDQPTADDDCHEYDNDDRVVVPAEHGASGHGASVKFNFKRRYKNSPD